MSFSATPGAIERMIRRELFQTRTARGIARKAGLRSGSSGVLPQVLASFALANSGTGYELTHDTFTPLPLDTIVVDLTDISLARLVANVAEASDASLIVSGASEDVEVGLASSGLAVGDWVPLASGMTTLSLFITAASGAGSVTFGLIQLQGI